MNADNWMIDLNYTQAIAQADELDRVANNVKSLSEEDVTKLISDLGACWEGTNADAYIAKVDILKKNLLKTAADIAKTAQAMREMATNIYNAEKEAQQIADVRTYND